MEFRQATQLDSEEIKSFTMDTFPWGDYLPNEVDTWIKDGNVYVIIENRRILAVASMLLLFQGTAWLRGLRVRKQERRRGIGKAITMKLLELAKNRGAKRAMLLVAEWNTASRMLVNSIGFEQVMDVWGGTIDPNATIIDDGNSIELIKDALSITNNYICLPDDPWTCTKASVEDVLSLSPQIYRGPGIGIGRFSVGQPTSGVSASIVSTMEGKFKESYGRYTMFELVL
ncbi:MAG: GNAT family N-acetyltransferase [Thermocladium sp.]